MFDAGSDYPRLLMKNEKTGSKMSILLDAPLLAEHGYSIIVTSKKIKPRLSCGIRNLKRTRDF